MTATVNTGFRVVDGLPPDWDTRVLATIPTMRANWIALAQQRLGAPLRTFVLDGDDSRYRIAMCGALLTAPGANRRMDPYLILSGAGGVDGLLANGPHPWRGLAVEDVFPCLLVMFPNYETAPAGYAARDTETVDEFVREITGWARGAGARSIAMTYVHPGFPELLDVLRRQGWLVATLTHRCDLDVTWNDFDGYLATLPSRRRVATRREIRAVRELGVELSDQPLAATDHSGLLALRTQLVMKYGGRADPAKEAALLDRLVAGFAPENLTVVQARRDGVLLGFTLFVRDADVWTALMTGSDYANPDARLSYFMTCFYHPAVLAPQRGIRTISLGLGSWQAKRLRGCRLGPVLVAARWGTGG
jgi:uncharacterized protein